MRVIRSQKPITPPFSLYSVDLESQLAGPEQLMWSVFPGWLAEGLSFFFRRNRYDVVITENHRTALVFGLLSRLFRRRALHLAKELYLDTTALDSRFAQRIFRTCLKHLDCVVTNCSAEVDAYSRFLDLPTERFRFLPWPSNLPLSEDSRDDGYVFAAGRSFRDWETLFKVARAFAVPFLVVAEARAIAALEKPANITVRCDISWPDYVELLRGAHIVVIPLKQTTRSIGQAAILEAMSLSKPIITARTPGTIDYIEHDRNGWLYEPGDGNDLQNQLGRLLMGQEARHRLSLGAAESIRREFNKSRYSERMVELVRELLAGPSRAI